MTWKINRRPTELAGTEPDEATTTESNETEESAPADDPVAQLKNELAAAKAELDQCQDRFLRKAAEFDNYRKRMDRERGEAAMLAKSSVLIEFLPVADACDRALESFKGSPGNDGLEQYREGVRLLYKQIHDVLNRIGVVPIEAQGRPFDPHLHEAVTREENAEHEDNTVIQELRRGYLFKERLLRPAQVRVSSRPPENESAAP